MTDNWNCINNKRMNSWETSDYWPDLAFAESSENESKQNKTKSDMS